MTNSQIIWKPINGFNGRYEISNHGDVRRKLSDNKYSMLKPSKQDDGYLRVLLSTLGSKPKLLALHRLVAEHFVDNPENKRYVTFRDHNKLNVDADNLVWSTYQELQALNEGVINYNKTKHSRKQRPVMCVTTGKQYPNIKTASRELHVSPANIVLCIKENRSTRSGLAFKFI